ncbi:MAG: zinc ribbon domain-containing protein [Minisyncoccia bacterium]
MEPNICPTCHQSVLSQYYFCPNCGAKIHEAPLSTTAGTQVWIYAFSVILPMICFIFVTRWPGVKYYKSEDLKAKRIGQIAWALLILSTIITIVLVYVWTQKMIQSSIDSINTDFGGM